MTTSCYKCKGKPADYRSEAGHLTMDKTTGATILEAHATTRSMDAMTQTNYRYWKHESGDIYAVQMDASGDIIGTCGPLHYKERESTPLDEYNYDSEDIDWVIKNSGNFRDVTQPSEQIQS